MIDEISVKFATVYAQQLRITLQSNKNFFLFCAGIWLLGLYYQLSYSQFALSIWVNDAHTPALDWIMVMLTYAGDGMFLTVVGAALILYRPKWVIPIVLCLSVPSLVTQFLKHQVFDDYHRPAILMEGIRGLYYVPGVDINLHNSFPSGHTTAGFSLYTMLALFSGRKQFGWIWAAIATLVGLSRVYLLQHFWMDILAGSCIGTVFCTMMYVAYQTYFPAKS